jgi:hypothetical protein
MIGNGIAGVTSDAEGCDIYMIVKRDYTPATFEMWKANAKLISAAPEMAEMLMRARGLIGGSNLGAMKPWADLMSDAWNLLKKAGVIE